MAITADFHLHSTHSGDGKSKMEDIVKSAIDRGLTQICFTEHNDIDFPYDERTREGMFDLNTDSYLYELLGLREKYSDKIKIGFGVELGMQTDAFRKNAVYAKSYDFDFIIFSCHIVNGLDPYYPQYFEGRSEEEAMREYFKCILDNVKLFNNYDVVGHLDYAIRYAPETDKNYSYYTYKDLIDKILETVIDNGKGIEVNTAGIRKYYLKDVHPNTDILKRYKELGGEIVTVGSDAHSVGYEGADFDRAYEALKAAGFEYYTTFEGRIASYHKL